MSAILDALQELTDGPAYFEFVVTVHGVADLTDDVADRLYETTGGTCTLAWQQGELIVLFRRWGGTRAAAIAGALRQVQDAKLPGMTYTTTRME